MPPCQKGPALTSNHGRPSLTPCQKGPVLTFDHGRPSLPPCQKGSALTSDHARITSNIHVRNALHLHLTMGGTHPATMSKRLSTYI